ncbi:MAG: ATP-binding protein, partial [Lewinella sp.]|nr:ATP-binding protein [Lewinella sp.]
MHMDHTSVWDSCLQTIRQHVNAQSFRTWFEPIRPVGLQEQALTIQVPNRFFYEWLEEHYVGLLKMTIRKELGTNGQLLYQIVNGKEASSAKAAEKHALTTATQQSSANSNSEQGYAPGMVDTGHIKNPFIIPGIKKPHIDPQLNEKYTFKTFIEGDCNQLARSAGLAIADRPGKSSFNPLIIYGEVGLGKTHLAQAIGHRVLELHPRKTVLYVATDKFTQQIIQSIKNNAVNDLINFYQFVDVLVVDDIQFLAN